jgi:hypothetical protein
MFLMGFSFWFCRVVPGHSDVHQDAQDVFDFEFIAALHGFGEVAQDGA